MSYKILYSIYKAKKRLYGCWMWSIVSADTKEETINYKRIQELKRRQNMKFKKSSGRVKRYYCSYCGSTITYDDYIKYNGLCFPCYCE